MENKFKFGDMVRCAETGEIFIVADLEKHENNIAVMCQSYARIHIVDENLLELIPHPDTIRLSWLEKEMLEDSHQTIVCDGYNEFCNIVTFRECIGPTFETIREAIDHEMKKQEKP